MERSRRITNDMGLEVKIHNPSTPLPDTSQYMILPESWVLQFVNQYQHFIL